jgi:hypothetical protein
MNRARRRHTGRIHDIHEAWARPGEPFIPKSFKVVLGAAVLLSLLVMGFVAWVIIALLSHFGVI